MIIELLKKLTDNSQRTLPQISHELGLSVIKTLSLIASINQYEADLIIESQGNFILSRNINWLDGELIAKLCVAKSLPHKFVLLNQIESTNSYALKNISNYTMPTIIISELQTNGRGRFGRNWSSKIGYDLTLSLVYQLPVDFNLPILPIIVAVAMNRLFKNYRIANKIKWPNDIYVNAEKVCGILVENICRYKQNNVVIGIGVDNIGAWERNQLLVDVVSEVDKLLSEFALFGFSFLRREWLDNCLHYQLPVALLRNDIIVANGVHCDLGESGELIINSPIGRLNFSNSELSLKINA